jgi:hypothetical protein
MRGQSPTSSSARSGRLAVQSETPPLQRPTTDDGRLSNHTGHGCATRVVLPRFLSSRRNDAKGPSRCEARRRSASRFPSRRTVGTDRSVRKSSNFGYLAMRAQVVRSRTRVRIADVEVRLRGYAASARQTSRERLACLDEARHRRAKSGWEAGIRTPIPWSREAGSGVGDFRRCRFS